MAKDDAQEVLDSLSEPDIGGEDDPKSDKKSKGKRSGSGGLKKQLREFFLFLGTLLKAVDDFDGQVLIDNAPDLADQLYVLADQNPRVKRALQLMLEGGAWSGVVGLIAVKVALPISVHHQLLPEDANARLAAVMEIPIREQKSKDDDEPPRVGEFVPGPGRAGGSASAAG